MNLNLASVERVWKSFAAADEFLRHEFVDRLQNAVVVNPKEWAPFFQVWRVLNEERPFLPKAIYNKGTSIVAVSLQPELNRLLNLLRELISTRQQGHDDKALLGNIRIQIKTIWDTFERELTALKNEIQNAIQQADSLSKRESITIGAISGVSGQLFIGQLNDVRAQQLANIDMRALAAELSSLRSEMRRTATDTEQDIATGQIAAAEAAAQSGDFATVARYLKSAGKWAFDVATKIGVTVASEASKKSAGL